MDGNNVLECGCCGCGCNEAVCAQKERLWVFVAVQRAVSVSVDGEHQQLWLSTNSLPERILAEQRPPHAASRKENVHEVVSGRPHSQHRHQMRVQKVASAGLPRVVASHAVLHASFARCSRAPHLLCVAAVTGSPSAHILFAAVCHEKAWHWENSLPIRAGRRVHPSKSLGSNVF